MAEERDDGVPSMQEMFDRAARGLASQGWMQSLSGYDRFGEAKCVYDMPMSDGSIRHCAWGWVDPEGTANAGTLGIGSLRRRCFGLAPRLSERQMEFAEYLQMAHDESPRPEAMMAAFIDLAARYGLSAAAMTEVTGP